MTLHQRYVDLLKKSLLDQHNADEVSYHPLHEQALVAHQLDHLVLPLRTHLCKEKVITLNELDNGRPSVAYSKAETMIGLKRLDNIEYYFHEIINLTIR